MAHTDSQQRLIDAIDKSDADAVIDAVRDGANPNLPDGNGDTPLHHAVAALVGRNFFHEYKEARKVLEAVLLIGGDPARTNEAGEKPRDIAARGRDDIPDNGPDVPDIDEIDWHKCTAHLLDYIEHNGPASVRTVLEHQKTQKEDSPASGRAGSEHRG